MFTCRYQNENLFKSHLISTKTRAGKALALKPKCRLWLCDIVALVLKNRGFGFEGRGFGFEGRGFGFGGSGFGFDISKPREKFGATSLPIKMATKSHSNNKESISANTN